MSKNTRRETFMSYHFSYNISTLPFTSVFWMYIWSPDPQSPTNISSSELITFITNRIIFPILLPLEYSSVLFFHLEILTFLSLHLILNISCRNMKCSICLELKIKLRSVYFEHWCSKNEVVWFIFHNVEIIKLLSLNFNVYHISC